MRVVECVRGYYFMKWFAVSELEEVRKDYSKTFSLAHPKSHARLEGNFYAVFIIWCKYCTVR